MLQDIHELYEYTDWANARTLEATSHLSREALDRDLGNSFPSVRETLAHILFAEWVWLERWRGRSPSGPADWDLGTHDAICERWDAVRTDRAAFLAALDEDALARPLSYRNTAGEPFTERLDRLLRHVVNHSSYHRGQITTMLRQLGERAPTTDLVVYFREQAVAR